MVTQIAAVCGVVFGFAGLVLSILNYFRDRPELVVALKWDMATTGDLKHDPNKLRAATSRPPAARAVNPANGMVRRTLPRGIGSLLSVIATS